MPVRFGFLFLLLLVSMFIVSCDKARVSSAYHNLSEAKEAGTVGKGWIPDFLPKSAHDIHELHYVELDAARVEFSFSSGDVSFLKGFVEIPRAEIGSVVKAARLDSWSKLQNNSGELRAFSRKEAGVEAFILVNFSANRAQYWD